MRKLLLLAILGGLLLPGVAQAKPHKGKDKGRDHDRIGATGMGQAGFVGAALLGVVGLLVAAAFTPVELKKYFRASPRVVRPAAQLFFSRCPRPPRRTLHRSVYNAPTHSR